MKKTNLIRSVCVILAVIMFTGSVTAAKKDSGCECDPSYTGPSFLELKVDTMNRKILLDCCVSEKVITHDQMTVAVHMFKSDIQKDYSKELICEQDGKKYYYPNFILDTSKIDDDYTDKTRYIIQPLDADENGVYKGIKVIYYKTPEPTEYELKRDEVNNKIKELEGWGLTKEEMESRVERFKSLQEKYSNSYLCTDENGTEHYCPEYELRIFDTVFEGDFYVVERPYNYTQNTRYIIRAGRQKYDDEILTVLYVEPFELLPLDSGNCALMQDK